MTQTIPALKIAQAFIAEEMNTITILKSETGWNIQYAGPHASRVRMLFATDILPTAFTQAAAPETVLAFVRDRHPGCYVELADTKWQRLCR